MMMASVAREPKMARFLQRRALSDASASPRRGVRAVPLLMWNEGDQQYVLKGSTFGTSWTGDDTTQWFGHFEVARVMGGFDIIIFEVSKNDGRRT